MDRGFQDISFCPSLYQSLQQAVLDEFQGHEEDVKVRALASGEAWLTHETYILDKARILSRRIGDVIRRKGTWEPNYAYKVLAKRLVGQLERSVNLID